MYCETMHYKRGNGKCCSDSEKTVSLWALLQAAGDENFIEGMHEKKMRKKRDHCTNDDLEHPETVAVRGAENRPCMQAKAQTFRGQAHNREEAT